MFMKKMDLVERISFSAPHELCPQKPGTWVISSLLFPLGKRRFRRSCPPFSLPQLLAAESSSRSHRQNHALLSFKNFTPVLKEKRIKGSGTEKTVGQFIYLLIIGLHAHINRHHSLLLTDLRPIPKLTS